MDVGAQGVPVFSVPKLRLRRPGAFDKVLLDLSIPKIPFYNPRMNCSAGCDAALAPQLRLRGRESEQVRTEEYQNPTGDGSVMEAAPYPNGVPDAVYNLILSASGIDRISWQGEVLNE